MCLVCFCDDKVLEKKRLHPLSGTATATAISGTAASATGTRTSGISSSSGLGSSALVAHGSAPVGALSFEDAGVGQVVAYIQNFRHYCMHSYCHLLHAYHGIFRWYYFHIRLQTCVHPLTYLHYTHKNKFLTSVGEWQV
jgi:hypothetical protein